MYPSDYYYTYANGVDNTCYKDPSACDQGTPGNGWLFNSAEQWTIAPSPEDVSDTFVVSNDGGLYDGSADYGKGVRPVVYLSSDIELSGSGMYDDPYVVN